MISDLDETLRKLLIDEMPVKNDEVEISFDQPKREWSARLSRPALNLFLYDLRENHTLRSPQWEQLPPAADPAGRARLKRSPFRIDCFYMITAWAAEPEDEHRLLSRCLMALFRFPTLPAERLVGELQGQPYEIQVRLASPEQIENPADYWSALDNEMRPTIPFRATLALDPWHEVSEPMVRTVIMRPGQAGPRPSRLMPESITLDRITIAGTVRSASAQKTPLPGIQVAVKGTGLFDRTDEQGRFTLGLMPPGEYTLVAWPERGKPAERQVTVPSTGGDYDLILEG